MSAGRSNEWRDPLAGRAARALVKGAHHRLQAADAELREAATTEPALADRIGAVRAHLDRALTELALIAAVTGRS